MDLSNLKPAKGATKSRKRIARGVGSGYGGHSSTKGNKGQKSRSGAKRRAWFEGGQMPLQRRVPKFGFKNRNRKEYSAVNVSQLEKLVADGRLAAGAEVTPTTLAELGVVGPKDLVKILGGGELKAKLNVQAHGFSASGRKKIEDAGGTATVVEQRTS
jgi:large subunit ribosomal protein L15